MPTLAAGDMWGYVSQNLCLMTSSSKLKKQNFFYSQLKSLSGQLSVDIENEICILASEADILTPLVSHTFHQTATTILFRLKNKKLQPF